MGATLDDTKQSPIGKDQVAQAHKDAGTLSQQLKKALGKDSDVTEPFSKSTVDTIKKVSKDGGKIIQYQQTDDITGEPIEEKPEVIATRQSVIATDADVDGMHIRLLILTFFVVCARFAWSALFGCM